MNSLAKLFGVVGTLILISILRVYAQSGPSIINAQVVERLSAGPGIDTLYATFSEAIMTNSKNGSALILIHNGAASDIFLITDAYLGNNRYKLVVSSVIAPPRPGDSLRINPAGPIADTLNNSASPSKHAGRHHDDTYTCRYRPGLLS